MDTPSTTPLFMRLLFTSHNAQLEGAPLNKVRIASWLQERGHQCMIIFPEHGPVTDLARRKNVPIQVIHECYKHPSPTLLNVIDRFRPDAMLVNTVLAGPLVEFIRAHRANVPLAWSIHESEMHLLSLSRPYISEQTFSLPDVMIFVSHLTQKVYRPLLTGPSVVIHNGMDMREVNAFRIAHDKRALRRQYDIPEDAFVPLLVGSICPRKGQKEFIESAVQMAERMTADERAHFVIVGKAWPAQKPYLEQALAHARTAGIEERIHVFPESDNMFDFYALADVYVCNSFIESLPTVVTEGMSFGLPVIAGTSYGVREQIEDGRNGLLYLPGHVSMLTERLLQMMRNPELCKRLGREARNTVEKRFSHTTMIDAYESLFRSLMTSQDPAQMPPFRENEAVIDSTHGTQPATAQA